MDHLQIESYCHIRLSLGLPSGLAFKNHSLNLARLSFVNVSNQLLKNKSWKCKYLPELMLTTVEPALLVQKDQYAAFRN